MAAGPWVLTTAAKTSIFNGDFDFNDDDIHVGLYLSTSNIGTGSTTIAGVNNEHANANGYTTGGIQVSPLVITGTAPLTISFGTNPVWTASGGSIVARFAVCFEVGGNVIAFCLLDSAPADVTTTDGNTLTVDSDGTPSPLLSVAFA
jgi:hypothetical protein